jgi:hypothetical protein
MNAACRLFLVLGVRDGFTPVCRSAALAKARGWRVVAAFVTRDEEIAEIDRFLGSHGAIMCPAAFIAPTSTKFSPAEEARRLERVRVKKSSKRDVLAAARRFYMSLRP